MDQQLVRSKINATLWKRDQSLVNDFAAEFSDGNLFMQLFNQLFNTNYNLYMSAGSTVQEKI